MQPIIKWSGSKRLVAKELLELEPKNYNRYFEPFIGGGSFSFYHKNAFCSDKNGHLIDLWNVIKDSPDDLLESYSKHHELFKSEGGDYYYRIRDRFNAEHSPFDFFFINRVCCGGMIRYNKKGEFNNGCGYGRYGIKPKNLKKILEYWHEKIKNNSYSCNEYSGINPSSGDFIFCDPPYETKNAMYFNDFEYGSFQEWLNILNYKKVLWMVTTRTEIDKSLYKTKSQTSSGHSSLSMLVNQSKKKANEFIFMNYKPDEKTETTQLSFL